MARINQFPVLSLALNSRPIRQLPGGITLRQAEAADLAAIRKLGEEFGYGLRGELDPAEFMLAIAGEKIVGFGRLIRYGKVFEACHLGVEEAFRGTGIGRMLMLEIVKRADGNVYLNTIIPEYFEPLGFRIIKEEIPFFLHKDAAWCGECPKEQCRHMVFEKPEEVPVFPDSRPLALRDQMLVRQIFAWDPATTSALSFLTLFKHSEESGLRMSLAGNNLCFFMANGQPQPYFLQPVGETGIRDTIAMALEHLRQTGVPPAFFLLSADFIRRHELEFDPRYTVTADRDYADYVYWQEDLASLKGNRYNGQRNYVSRFKSSYAYEYNEMTPADIADCLAFIQQWFAVNNGKFGDPQIAAAKFGRLVTALHSIHHAKGALIRVNGKIVAITLGEALTTDTVLVHMEMADTNYVGAYQAINQLFCERSWEEFTFINRQEDGGIEGQRRAKTAYHPAFLAEMFDLRPVA